MTRQHKDLGIAEVVVPGVEKIFHYTIPEAFGKTALPGVRVRVSLGRRSVTGYFVARRKESSYPELKPLADILDFAPKLTAEMIKLTRWVSEYYFAPWGTVIRSVLPKGLDAVRSYRLDLTTEGREAVRVSPLFESIRSALTDQALTLKQLERRTGKKKIKSRIDHYCKKGFLSMREEVRGAVKKKMEKVYRSGVDSDWLQEHIHDLQKQTPSQARVLKDLQNIFEPLTALEIRTRTGAGPGVIGAMVEKGLLRQQKRELIRDPFAGDKIEEERPHVLTPEQEAAVQAVSSTVDGGLFETFLLYGVTGSGKTEVYLRLIQGALAHGREAIVIVPEIALTPQLVRIFRARFGNQVAVLHSGLSDGERYDQWNRIREGKAAVAIGARSAIFAPFAHLGLIVVDEEHDATYKQEEVPRYHARDVAVVRAKLAKAVVILGSATPSLESYYHARSGKYRFIALEKRIEDRPLPEVSLIDMKEVKGVSPLSPKLTEAVQNGLEREEQVLLFLNRRGYAPFLLCSTCGHVLICPNCSVSLT
jgi:primosomal protein N' (replication factor Y)